MERRLSVGIGIIGVVGAAVWIGAAGRRTAPTRQIDAAVAELEMSVRESAAGAQARAVTLSQLPRIGWAVATDEATVRDLTTEELAFRPQPGEHIEIAQVEREQGRVRRLIRIPADARPALNVSRVGFLLIVDADQVHVLAVVNIEPRDRDKILNGLLAVAQRLDTSTASARFAALGIGARLESLGGSIVVNDKRSGGTVSEVGLSLRGPAAEGVKLVLTIPGGVAWGHVGGGLLLLIACAVSSLVLLRRSDAAAALPQAGASSAVRPATIQAERERPTAEGQRREQRMVAQDSAARPPGGSDGLGSGGRPTGASTPTDAEAFDEQAFDVDDPTVVGETAGAASANAGAASANAGAASVNAGAASANSVGRGAASIPGTSLANTSGTLPPVPGVHLPPPSVSPTLPGIHAPIAVASLSQQPGEDHPTHGAESNDSRSLEVSGPVFPRGMSTTVPSVLFMTGGGTPDRVRPSALHAADNPWTAEYRKLFTEFVKLRRTCGESTEDLNRDRFVEALQQKRIELVERHGATDVKFRLAFDNGKAAVRFKTVT